MKLYVANLSKQNYSFAYRLPEERNNRQQDIRVGAQAIVGDFALDTINYIVRQHEVYNIVNVKELKRTKGFVGICFSIDKPVQLDNADFVDETVERNDAALNDRAEERREEASASIAGQISDAMREHGVNVPRAEIEIKEETRGTPRINSGYEVVRDGVQPRHGGRHSNRHARR